MEGNSAVQLLLGFDVRVHVKLNDFFLLLCEFHQVFQISVQGGLRTVLVRFDLVEDLEKAKFCGSVKTQEVSYNTLDDMQGRPCAVGICKYFGLNDSQVEVSIIRMSKFCA